VIGDQTMFTLKRVYLVAAFCAGVAVGIVIAAVMPQVWVTNLGSAVVSWKTLGKLAILLLLIGLPAAHLVLLVEGALELAHHQS
jgi:hypothetical protein